MASVVLPIAKLFFACAAVEIAPTGSQRIIDPLASLIVPTGAVSAPRIDFYSMMIGGAGTFRFSVRCSIDGFEIGRANLAEVTFGPDNRADVFVLPASLTNARFRRSGVYVFSLVANHTEIAIWELPVIV